MTRKSFVILLLLILLLIGCNEGEALSTDTLIDKELNNIDLESINEYNIEVELDDKNKTYTGRQYTSFINNSSDTLTEIYFHIYPNAFKTLERAPIIMNKDFDDPLSYNNGFIDILQVSVGDADLEYDIIGEDETLLKITLDVPLLPEEKIDIFLGYDAKLPNIKDRYGYSDRVMNIGNWYPILSVYDEDGWNMEPYYKIGDPFYSDIANYKVEITTNKDIVVAASGNILTEIEEGDKKVYQIEGRLIRDFAWAASTEFKVKQVKADDTVVKLYYLDEKSTTIRYSLNAGSNSIKTFNNIFGKYPYGQYSIVMTDFSSGMEYPGLVLIGNDYFNYSSRDILEQIIVHETAHQWWYGLVGNNQVLEAWLDEALATYSEIIYNKEIYGKEKGREYYNKYISDGFELGKRYLGDDQQVNRHLKEFNGWNDYSILVYTKGAMLFNQIKNDYNEEILYRILSEYFNEYKYYNATSEDFLRICEEVTGDSFVRFANTWLN